MEAVADVLEVVILRWSPLPSVHAAIPPILDRIVASVAKPSGDLSPSLAHLVHKLLDHFAFLSRNWFVIKTWLQILVVSLATLLR